MPITVTEERQYLENLFNNFVQQTKDAVEKGNEVQQLLMAIPGIITGSNTITAMPDSVPLITFQDYYSKAGDRLGSSIRNENSPSAAPAILFALQGGKDTVTLFGKYWASNTIEAIQVARIHETEGTTQPVYIATYSLVKIIAITEILIRSEWYVVVIARSGSVQKLYTAADSKGIVNGNIVEGWDFLKGEKVQ